MFRSHEPLLVAAIISLLSVWGGVQSSGVVHCQPGDPACAKCQASCDTIDLGSLPECCEVYSACCPTYSNQCRSCEANTAVDPHFPEYCCASFTDCCHLVPGLTLPPDFSARQQTQVQPAPTTLQTTSISQAPQEVAVQNPSPGARGRVAATLTPSPASTGHSLQPRTRQRSAVADTSRSARPTPSVRKTAEPANNSRRGRVTSRGRVVE